MELRRSASLRSGAEPGSGSTRARLVQYYSEAGLDFGAWSKDLNMHFGFFRRGINPLNREAMLNELNRQVLERLNVDHCPEARLLDMGCGVGATSRYAAQMMPQVNVTGITLVPWQVDRARRLTAAANLQERVKFVCGDYSKMDEHEDRYDGAYAIESSCYATGYSKHDFLLEAHRVLKPGGRLVVADGFLKSPTRDSGIVSYCYRKICDCWVIADMAEVDHFRSSLESIGFVDIEVEEISWKLFPSVLHIPLVAAKFLVEQIFSSHRPMSRMRRNHIIAPVLLPVIGLARRRFGYFFVTAKKRGHG